MISARNAGWSVGNFKRVMRWGVYACTLLAVVGMALSFHSGVSVSWARLTGSSGDRAIRLHLSADSGRVRVFFDPSSRVVFSGNFLPPKDHLRVRHYRSQKKGRVLSNGTIVSRRDWWEGPASIPERHLQYSSRSKIWDLPFAYALALLIGLSIWVYIRRKQNYPRGYCQFCGYLLDGISDQACPECGVERG